MSAHVINVDINGNLKLNDINGLAGQIEKWQASGVTLPVNLQESFTKLKSEIAKGGVVGGQAYAQTFMQNFAKEIKRGSFTQQNMRMIQSYFGESFVKAAQHHGSEYVRAMQTSARKEAAAQRTKFNDELGKIGSREYESLYGRAYAAAKNSARQRKAAGTQRKLWVDGLGYVKPGDYNGMFTQADVDAYDFSRELNHALAQRVSRKFGIPYDEKAVQQRRRDRKLTRTDKSIDHFVEQLEKQYKGKAVRSTQTFMPLNEKGNIDFWFYELNRKMRASTERLRGKKSAFNFDSYAASASQLEEANKQISELEKRYSAAVKESNAAARKLRVAKQPRDASGRFVGMQPRLTGGIFSSYGVIDQYLGSLDGATARSIKLSPAAKSKLLRNKGKLQARPRTYKTTSAFSDPYLDQIAGDNLYWMIQSGEIFKHVQRNPVGSNGERTGEATRVLRSIMAAANKHLGRDIYGFNKPMNAATQANLAEFYLNNVQGKMVNRRQVEQAVAKIKQESPYYVTPSKAEVNTKLARRGKEYWQPRQKGYLEYNMQTGETGTHMLDESGWRRKLNQIGAADDRTSMMWVKADNLDRKGQARLQDYIKNGIWHNGQLYTHAAGPANEARSGMTPFIRNDLARAWKEATWGGLSAAEFNSFRKVKPGELIPAFTANKVANDLGTSLTGSMPLDMLSKFTVQAGYGKKAHQAQTSLLESLIVVPEQEVKAISEAWTNSITGRQINNVAQRKAAAQLSQSITDGQTIMSKEWADEINRQSRKFNPNAAAYSSGQLRGEGFKSNGIAFDWKRMLTDLISSGAAKYEDFYFPDIYGNQHHALDANVQAITTDKSMKWAKAYKSQSDMIAKLSRGNGLALENTAWGVVNRESSSKQQRTWSMQMLQNRGRFSLEELQQIIDPHNQAFQDALTSPEGFFKFTGISKNSVVGRNLVANPNLLTTQSYLKLVANRAFSNPDLGTVGHFDRGAAGKLITDSPFARAIADPVEALSHIFGTNLGMQYVDENGKTRRSSSAIPVFNPATGRYEAYRGKNAVSNEVYSPIAFQKGAIAGSTIATNRFPNNVASNSTLVDAPILRKYAVEGSSNLVYFPGRNSGITGQNTDWDGDMMELVFGKQGKQHPLAKELSGMMKELIKPEINSPRGSTLSQNTVAKQIADAFGARQSIGVSANNITRFISNFGLDSKGVGSTQDLLELSGGNEAAFLSLLAYSYGEIDKAKSGYGFKLPEGVSRLLSSQKYPLMQYYLDKVKGHASRGSQYKWIDESMSPDDARLLTGLDQITVAMNQSKAKARQQLAEMIEERNTKELVPHRNNIRPSTKSGADLFGTGTYAGMEMPKVVGGGKEAYIRAFAQLGEMFGSPRKNGDIKQGTFYRDLSAKNTYDNAREISGQQLNSTLVGLPKYAEAVMRYNAEHGFSISKTELGEMSKHFYNQAKLEAYEITKELRGTFNSIDNGTASESSLAAAYNSIASRVSKLPRTNSSSKQRIFDTFGGGFFDEKTARVNANGKKLVATPMTFLERAIQSMPGKGYRMKYVLEPGRVLGYTDGIEGSKNRQWHAIENIEMQERLARELMAYGSTGNTNESIAKANNLDKYWMSSVEGEGQQYGKSAKAIAGMLSNLGSSGNILEDAIAFAGAFRNVTGYNPSQYPESGGMRKSWGIGKYMTGSGERRMFSALMENRYSTGRKPVEYSIARQFDSKGDPIKGSGMSLATAQITPEAIKHAAVQMNNVAMEEIFKTLGPNASVAEYQEAYKRLQRTRQSQQSVWNNSRFAGNHLITAENPMRYEGFTPEQERFNRLQSKFERLAGLESTVYGIPSGFASSELTDIQKEYQAAIRAAFGGEYVDENGKTRKVVGANNEFKQLIQAKRGADPETARAIDEYITSRQLRSKIMTQSERDARERRIAEIDEELSQYRNKRKGGVDNKEYRSLDPMAKMLAQFQIKFGREQQLIAAGTKANRYGSKEQIGFLNYGTMSDEEFWGNMSPEQMTAYNKMSPIEQERIRSQGYIPMNPVARGIVDSYNAAQKVSETAYLLEDSNWQYLMGLRNGTTKIGDWEKRYIQPEKPKPTVTAGSATTVSDMLAAGVTTESRKLNEIAAKEGLYRMWDAEKIEPLRAFRKDGGYTTLTWKQSADMSEKNLTDLLANRADVNNMVKNAEAELTRMAETAARMGAVARGKDANTPESLRAKAWADKVLRLGQSVEELRSERAGIDNDIDLTRKYIEGAKGKQASRNALPTIKGKYGQVTGYAKGTESPELTSMRARLISEARAVRDQGYLNDQQFYDLYEEIRALPFDNDMRLEWQNEEQRKAAEEHRNDPYGIKRAEREAERIRQQRQNRGPAPINPKAEQERKRREALERQRQQREEVRKANAEAQRAAEERAAMDQAVKDQAYNSYANAAQARIAAEAQRRKPVAIDPKRQMEQQRRAAAARQAAAERQATVNKRLLRSPDLGGRTPIDYRTYSRMIEMYINNPAYYDQALSYTKRYWESTRGRPQSEIAQNLGGTHNRYLGSTYQPELILAREVANRGGYYRQQNILKQLKSFGILDSFRIGKNNFGSGLEAGKGILASAQEALKNSYINNFTDKQLEEVSFVANQQAKALINGINGTNGRTRDALIGKLRAVMADEQFQRYQRSEGIRDRIGKLNTELSSNISDARRTEINKELSGLTTTLSDINKETAQYLINQKRYTPTLLEMQKAFTGAYNAAYGGTKAGNRLTGIYADEAGNRARSFGELYYNYRGDGTDLTRSRLGALGYAAAGTINRIQGRSAIYRQFAGQQVNALMYNAAMQNNPIAAQYMQLRQGRQNWIGNFGTVASTRIGEAAPVGKTGEYFTQGKTIRGKSAGIAFTTAAGRYLEGQAMNHMNRVYGSQMMWSQAVGYIQKFYTYTKALNDEMRIYKKIQPDWDTKDMNQYIDGLGEIGLTYGKSISEMANASSTMTRAGYGGKTAEAKNINTGMTEQAILLSNISDEELDVDTAASEIVSAVKAWGIADEQATAFAQHYNDAVNEVSNSFAVTSNDITDNLQTTASAAAMSGMSMDQVIALLTAGSEISRSSSKTSTAMKTMIGRFNQINDPSSKTVGAWLKDFMESHGVRYKNNEGQLDFFSMVQDMYENVWDTLSQDEQQLFSQKIAGSRQAPAWGNWMQNGAQIQNVLETSINSAGSAAESNAVMMNSIEGAQARLNAAQEKFFSAAISSDAIIGGIDALSAALNALNSIPFASEAAGIGALTLALGALSTMAPIMAKFMGAGMLGGIVNIAKGGFMAAGAAGSAGKAMKGLLSGKANAASIFSTALLGALGYKGPAAGRAAAGMASAGVGAGRKLSQLTEKELITLLGADSVSINNKRVLASIGGGHAVYDAEATVGSITGVAAGAGGRTSASAGAAIGAGIASLLPIIGIIGGIAATVAAISFASNKRDEHIDAIKTNFQGLLDRQTMQMSQQQKYEDTMQKLGNEQLKEQIKASGLVEDSAEFNEALAEQRLDNNSKLEDYEKYRGTSEEYDKALSDYVIKSNELARTQSRIQAQQSSYIGTIKQEKGLIGWLKGLGTGGTFDPNLTNYLAKYKTSEGSLNLEAYNNAQKNYWDTAGYSPDSMSPLERAYRRYANGEGYFSIGESSVDAAAAAADMQTAWEKFAPQFNDLYKFASQWGNAKSVSEVFDAMDRMAEEGLISAKEAKDMREAAMSQGIVDQKSLQSALLGGGIDAEDIEVTYAASDIRSLVDALGSNTSAAEKIMGDGTKNNPGIRTKAWENWTGEDLASMSSALGGLTEEQLTQLYKVRESDGQAAFDNALQAAIGDSLYQTYGAEGLMEQDASILAKYYQDWGMKYEEAKKLAQQNIDAAKAEYEQQQESLIEALGTEGVKSYKDSAALQALTDEGITAAAETLQYETNTRKSYVDADNQRHWIDTQEGFMESIQNMGLGINDAYNLIAAWDSAGNTFTDGNGNKIGAASMAKYITDNYVPPIDANVSALDANTAALLDLTAATIEASGGNPEEQGYVKAEDGQWVDTRNPGEYVQAEDGTYINPRHTSYSKDKDGIYRTGIGWDEEYQGYGYGNKFAAWLNSKDKWSGINSASAGILDNIISSKLGDNIRYNRDNLSEEFSRGPTDIGSNRITDILSKINNFGAGIVQNNKEQFQREFGDKVQVLDAEDNPNRYNDQLHARKPGQELYQQYGRQFGNIDVFDRQLYQGDGYHATIFGSWDDVYDSNRTPIAYSPLLQNANGIPTLLSDDQVYGYISGLVQLNGGKVDSNLIELDKQGIDGIKNLIAAVGEDAPLISEAMHEIAAYGEQHGLTNYQLAYDKMNHSKVDVLGASETPYNYENKSTQSKYESSVSDIKVEDKTAKIKYEADVENIEIPEIPDQQFDVQANVTSAQAQMDKLANTKLADKTITVNAVNNAQRELDKIRNAANSIPTNKTIHVSVSGADAAAAKLSSLKAAKGGTIGRGALIGERHADGGLTGTGNTLGTWLGDEYNGSGEKKPELVVTPDGNAHLAGLNGWEYEQLPKGTRVYSNTDTKKMLGDNFSLGGLIGERHANGGYIGQRHANTGNVGSDYDPLATDYGKASDAAEWSWGSNSNNSKSGSSNNNKSGSGSSSKTETNIEGYVKDIKEQLKDSVEKYTTMLKVITDQIDILEYEEDKSDILSAKRFELEEQQLDTLNKYKEALESKGATIENSEDYRNVLAEIEKLKKTMFDNRIKNMERVNEISEHRREQLERQYENYNNPALTYQAIKAALDSEQEQLYHIRQEYLDAGYSELSDEVMKIDDDIYQNQKDIKDLWEDCIKQIEETYNTIYQTTKDRQDYFSYMADEFKNQLQEEQAFEQQKYDDETERLNKLDKEIDRAKRIQDAEAALVDAQKKRVMVMTESGWQWKSDPKSVRDAQKSLDDTKEDLARQKRDDDRAEAFKEWQEDLWEQYYGPGSDGKEAYATVDSIYQLIKDIEDHQKKLSHYDERIAYYMTYGNAPWQESLIKEASEPELGEATLDFIDQKAMQLLDILGLSYEQIHFDGEGRIDIMRTLDDFIGSTDVNQLDNTQKNAVHQLEILRDDLKVSQSNYSTYQNDAKSFMAITNSHDVTKITLLQDIKDAINGTNKASVETSNYVERAIPSSDLIARNREGLIATAQKYAYAKNNNNNVVVNQNIVSNKADPAAVAKEVNDQLGNAIAGITTNAKQARAGYTPWGGDYKGGVKSAAYATSGSNAHKF